jgi:dipeptidyl aminopeptidase/acylaminoacyl peptidase
MRITKITIFILSMIFCFPFAKGKAEEQKRAMTFLDVIQMRTLGDADISPDGKWFVYTVSVPHWQKNRSFSDIYVTPLTGGETSRMTFTQDKNERLPKWYKDGSFFAFLSNRSEGKNQIYFINPDEGEAHKVSDDTFGVNSYEWSKNCKYLAYLGGKPDGRQIWIMPGKGGKAEKLTEHKTPISSYIWNPDGKIIYFVAPDSIDLLDKERKEKGFDVEIRDVTSSPSHLWEINVETREEKRLTRGDDYSVSQVEISGDGTKIAFTGFSTSRYATYRDSEVYLLDLSTNIVSRITYNSVFDLGLSFSPDSKWFAYICRDDGVYMNLCKIYIMPVGGGETRKLLGGFDYNDFLAYNWSDDCKQIYFTSQVGVNFHLFKVSINNDEIEQITISGGSFAFVKDEDSGKFLISFSDSKSPRDYYYSEPENFADKNKWVKLTDLNPQTKNYLFGKQETISWKSSDGRIIEGLLIKPVNYRENRKYPLIVQVHGGPMLASYDDFKAYVQVFAANDYVIFQPNYRGSSGYGEKFKKEMAGDYFGQPFEDIMTGVDYLIEKGLVLPDSMGIMGWSAGGDLSNWALVSTNRFKAISTGAGNVTPILDAFGAMAEFYFEGTLYDNWDHYAEMSSIRYIKNARTPTLIHCGEYDMNNIRQCEALYNALKRLGIPTEFLIYPNTGHVIFDMRYQIVKMQAEFNWFEKWIKGKESWIDWNEMIETLKKEEK